MLAGTRMLLVGCGICTGSAGTNGTTGGATADAVDTGSEIVLSSSNSGSVPEQLYDDSPTSTKVFLVTVTSCDEV